MTGVQTCALPIYQCNDSVHVAFERGEVERGELISRSPRVDPLLDSLIADALEVLDYLDDRGYLAWNTLEHGMMNQREASFIGLIHHAEWAILYLHNQHLVLFRL